MAFGYQVVGGHQPIQGMEGDLDILKVRNLFIENDWSYNSQHPRDICIATGCLVPAFDKDSF
jgi:hypothetical protein